MTKVLVLADGDVGVECFRWLAEKHQADIGLVATMKDNEISAIARHSGVQTIVFEGSDHLGELLQSRGMTIDLGFLIWWPTIIKQPLLSLPKRGFVNTHPSLLPFNRGKHYNFWAIVEQAPFGVTLHKVEEGIDCGAILAQSPIGYGWEDNGGTLYHQARQEMISLFKSSYAKLTNGELAELPQDMSAGSFHLARELDAASTIDLNKEYKARDLLNLLRARTFAGHPGCRFNDAGTTYEVTVSIRKVS